MDMLPKTVFFVHLMSRGTALFLTFWTTYFQIWFQCYEDICNGVEVTIKLTCNINVYTFVVLPCPPLIHMTQYCITEIQSP